MARKRKPIPPETQRAVLLKSRRRCCLCFWLDRIDEERAGQIAHLDHNHDNHVEDNLVFLCLEHHDKYDSKTSTSKRLREDEVREYRNRLYREMEGTSTVDPGLASSPAYEVPPPPLHFVSRQEELHDLKKLVLDSLDKPVAIVGLQGMGGIGKSVLAACLAREEGIRAAFPDGIFWIVVGQTPAVESLRSLAVRLRQAMAGKACLVILDDVWEAEHATAFHVLGPNCRLLLTTRDASLIHVLGAAEYRLDRLGDEESFDLLAGWSGEPRDRLAEEPAVRAVMRECDNLPLALAVCGAMRLDGVAWAEVQTALEKADLTALYPEIPEYRQNTVLKSIHVGIEFLRSKEPEIAQRYLELAVFAEDAVVPEAAVATIRAKPSARSKGTQAGSWRWR